MTHKQFDDANEAEKDKAMLLLAKLLRSDSMHHDRALRFELREACVACIRERRCLNLSDPETPLGQLMMRANARSKKNRWM